jgi:hypothetical protein
VGDLGKGYTRLSGQMLQKFFGQERELLGRLCGFLLFGSLLPCGEAHNLGHDPLLVENPFLSPGIRDQLVPDSGT